jgi:GNAT superfamily N-acetyltransferase
MPASARQRSGLRLIQSGPVTGIACEGDPHLLFNRIGGIGLSGSVEQAELADAVASLRAPARPANFLALVSERVELADTMAVHGLVPFRRDWLVLARAPEAAATVTTAFRIARVGHAEAPAFADILLEGFDLMPPAALALAGLVEQPGWHLYAAFAGAEAVAGAALFVHEGLAYFGFGATRPSQRGAGAHDALIAQRITLARELGCDALIVETGAPVAGEGSPSLNNLQAAGFRPVLARRAFAPAGTTWSGRSR